MKSIRNVLVTILATVTIAIFVFQSVFTFFQFRSIVFQSEQDKLQLQVTKEASHLEGMLEKTGKLTQSFSYAVSNGELGNIANLEKTLVDVVKADPLIVGGGFWMEPYVFNPNQKLFGRYAARNGSTVALDPQYSNGSYDYLSQDWYKVGLVDSPLVWTEPYEDPISKVPMITAESPIRHGEKIAGTVTMDIGLSELTKSVENLKVGSTGYGFIVSKSGTYVAHHDSAKNLKVKITDETEAGVREIADTILKAAEPGMTMVAINGSDHYATFSPIGNTGMILVTLLPTAEVMAPVNQLLTISSVIFLVSIVIFICVLYWFINRQVAQPLQYLKDGIRRLVEHKDLTKQITIQRKDEIGQVANALNEFIADLHGVVRNINDYAVQVDGVAQNSSVKSNEAKEAFQQVAVSFQEVTNGTEHQLHSSEESARAMEEMAIGIQRVAEASLTMADSSKKMADEAVLGNNSISKVTAQMDSIHHSVSNSAQAVRSLDSRSQEISQIIEAIASIASQTNLLALNAAIEAARAGEQGRGFAVVADEVRKLAEQSNDSATQIANLIAEIQKETSFAVEAMSVGSEQVDIGIAVAKEAGEAFHRIMNATQTVSDQIQEISSVAEEMSAAAEQVSASIQQLSQIAQESARNASGVASSVEDQLSSMNDLSVSAEKLSHMAHNLKNLVGKFTV